MSDSPRRIANADQKANQPLEPAPKICVPNMPVSKPAPNQKMILDIVFALE